ncbi:MULTISPECIES: NUDIX domain-containing protein [unclassified Streptomyces]|uniref:NUDIX domain-containing protein n=1 Tax=unclassified Streptomyces TaxID=2593676 RepID=UPI0016613BDA|nr:MULTISPECIES: NUDIX domain-containing protein [unclassified Streptomyces]MBD0708803.1 DNA mismatch repair protein MutT [Streptomyces sp. CBMA291]MBD0714741.1 DNA mismatch repair protein MutT [Streptomyces sp. CBMA370]
MPDKRSAGLLVFRRPPDGGVEVLIGHMGGPFWASREEAAWSIPKGEYGPEEAPEAAARREFQEELGLAVPEGPWLDLGESRQRGGKTVTVWAVEGTLDPASVVPGTFTLEWPPRSGVRREFPEVDRVGWFAPEAAAPLLVQGQRVFLERLVARLEGRT